MNKIIAIAVVAIFGIVAVIGATMWLRRAVYNVVTTVTVDEEYPGILCAKLVTRDGAAIDCWRDEPASVTDPAAE
jgi:Flp pilus assembly protein CpaB